MRRSRVTTLAASSLAAAGILAGHWLAYAVVHPDAHTRRAALSAGHGWLSPAQELVPLAAVAAVAAIVLTRLVRRLEPTPARGPLVRQLASAQAGTFAVLELAERVAGAPWSDVVGVLAVGLAAQVVIAWVVAGAIVRLARLGVRVGDVLARAADTRPGRLQRRVLCPLTSAHAVDGTGRITIRGPPPAR